MPIIKSQEQLCLSLLRAETEDEVIELLKKQKLWDDHSLWQPYGGMDMNRSLVGNQQSSPVAALVEKIVNSLDATLTSECLKTGVDPKSSEAPQSMQEAVEVYFSVPEGKIQNLRPAMRTEIGKSTQVITSGSKKNPNYIIIDDGEGQSPDNFEHTFLSLLRENKTGIPFVQGKFNMGGTGVLQFAGTNSFQLIISRRQPDITDTSKEDSGIWGFTIIRRLNPTKDIPHSTYVFLAPNKKIPRFTAESISAKPGPYPHLYQEECSSGTVIKLWNFRLPGGLKTNLMLDMRRALEKHLLEPALPIRLYERRPGYRAHSYDTTMSGLLSIIADSPDDIEDGLDTGSPLSIENVGKLKLRITVLKEEFNQGSNSKYPKGGVFFIVNGQLHGELDKGFIERRTKLDYIANSTLVTVDCTTLSERIREDLFMGSRDRMRECTERDALYDAVADYIKEHRLLRDLNARRRQERMKAAMSDDETAKLFQDLVRSDPTLAALFGKGNKIKVPKGPNIDKEPYTGKYFPTYFKLEKEPDGGLLKKCPKNRRCRLIFETDAVNDYFSRSKDPGRLETSGTPNLASIHLWNGKATLTYELPPNSSLGDIMAVSTELTDISRVDPFTSSFRIQVESEVLEGPDGGKRKPQGTLFTGLPNITEIYKKDWANEGFNETTTIALRSGGDGDSEELDIAINLDNIYLQNERIRRKGFDPDILNYWFKYGICLLALGMVFVQSKREDKKSDTLPTDGGRFDNIAKACEGLAVTIIPVISQLSKEKKLYKK